MGGEGVGICGSLSSSFLSTSFEKINLNGDACAAGWETMFVSCFAEWDAPLLPGGVT